MQKKLNRTLYTELFKIALPVALNNLVISSLSFVDTLMIGQLGEVEIAAVGIGNQLFFLYTLLLFGIGSASGIFVSQFWGKKDYSKIKKTSGLSVCLGLVAASPFVICSLLIPEQIVSVFTKDDKVIVLGAEYIKTVGISYIFSSVSITMAQVQRSLERPMLPFLVSLIALGLNTTLNYFFIFGKAGFPMLGVKGVALATTISRFVECVVMLILIYKGKENPAAGSFRELFGFKVDFLKKFAVTAAPVILNEMFWALGMTVYKIVYGRMGTESLASVNIAESITNLLFIVIMGSATASAVLTGKKIGQGDYTSARKNGGKFLKLSLLEGIVVAFIGIAFSNILPNGFNVSPELKNNARLIIIVFSLYMPFKAFNTHTIVGILRGGGDTLFAAVIEIAGVWGVGVVLAVLTGLVFNFQIHIVYSFVCIEEVVKAIITLIRFKTGKWVHDLT
ncbi:MAG: MATE family efflux transporter [Spirochaetales bacterium]|nr:MATE family efflux transporter [Spirochaetales bacterium]